MSVDSDVSIEIEAEDWAPVSEEGKEMSAVAVDEPTDGVGSLPEEEEEASLSDSEGEDIQGEDNDGSESGEVRACCCWGWSEESTWRWSFCLFSFLGMNAWYYNHDDLGIV